MSSMRFMAMGHFFRMMTAQLKKKNYRSNGITKYQTHNFLDSLFKCYLNASIKLINKMYFHICLFNKKTFNIEHYHDTQFGDSDGFSSKVL